MQKKESLLNKIKLSGCRYSALGNLVAYNIKDTTFIRVFGDCFGIPDSAFEHLQSNIVISGVGCIESIYITDSPIRTLTIDMDPSVPSFKSLKLLNCKYLREINFKSVNTSLLHSLDRSFIYCESLEELDLSSFCLDNIYNMNQMCLECESLKSIKIGDAYLSNLTNMDSVFESCFSLTEIQLGNIDIPKCQDFRKIFRECRSLEHIDLSSVHVRDLRYALYLFSGCSRLKEIIPPPEVQLDPKPSLEELISGYSWQYVD